MNNFGLTIRRKDVDEHENEISISEFNFNLRDARTVPVVSPGWRWMSSARYFTNVLDRILVMTLTVEHCWGPDDK
jgi:hypothetical protein